MADQAALLKTLKSNRTTIKATCTRFRTYLTDLDVPGTQLVELRQRLQRFVGLWDSFNDVQAGIEAIESADHFEQGHQEERGSFETRYFAVTVDLETLIERKTEIQNVHNVQESQQSRKGTSVSQGSVNDHLKLPRVTMPTFSGKYEEWIPFRNIFLSMIDQNPTLPSIQKMQYLLSVLRGEAHDVVSSLETSDENYPEAWKMLKERYDDDSLIIQKHIRALFEQPVLAKENHMALRRMLDNVLKHMRALKALKRPTEQWDDVMIYFVTSRLDQATSKEWETSVKKGEMPKFAQLTDFLSQRCRALEASSRTQKIASNAPSQGKPEQKKSITTHVATTNVMCAFCEKDHPIYKCTDFAQLEIDQRIKEARTRKLCLNCLKAASHQAKQCGSGACRKCGKRHNTLLHLDQNSKRETEPNPPSTVSTSGAITATTSVNLAAVRRERQVLLATAVVNVMDSKGKTKPCRALLDCGSQSCFVTTSYVEKLGLKQIATHIPISGLGEISTQTRSLAKITIQSRINGYQAKLDCLVIEKITQFLPANQLDLDELQIPDGITLADPEFNQSSMVDLLIGAEIFFELLCIGKIQLAEDQPIWQKTVLGWIVSGRFTRPDLPKIGTLCHLAINDELNANLSRFWQIEHNERRNTRTPEERLCEGQFAPTDKRNAEGRFIVTLPTREKSFQMLGESRNSAMKRFEILERKLERKPRLKKEYSDFIHEYEKLGHMRELNSDNPSWDVRPHFYLPHHCVIKETSTTTRLRVVFDASSKTTSGISLNDALLVGPVLQEDLFSILLRFRSFEHALTADIAKMYRQVLVDENQVPLQRIVWRDQTTDNIKTYELLTLTYGTAPASFLATKVIQQLANLEEKEFPVGAMIARRDFYVDDLITGANSEEDGRIIRDQTKALLQKGGLLLRQWASNNKHLLEDISDSSSTNAVLELDKDGTAKTLGIKWNPTTDMLQYSISMETVRASSHTKRSILSSIAQIFDPLGLLGPVVVVAKILIQRLWKLQIGWDESLPSDVHTEWSEYAMKMQSLDGFDIQRKIITAGSDVVLQLHGFCDASERAYGACIYIRSSNSHECLQVQLLCSKSRVAPLKAIPIPRLELCGAQLLTQLMSKVKNALGLVITKTYYWTDSSIVLHWIRAQNKKLPVFVAHRIGEIQEMTAISEWNHVGTKENPADLVSRGVTPKELKASLLWWNGPQWLHDDDISKDLPQIHESGENQLNESIGLTSIAMAAQTDTDPFAKFSTFSRLIRVTAMCVRFIRICRKEFEQKPSGPLSLEELEHARKCIIKKEQQSAFSEEFGALREGVDISKKSRLKDINPFIDGDGLLRVGGRLQHSELQYDAKHPVVLPHRSRLTELIVKHEHQKNLHAGADATLAAVRQLYWPLRARGIVKQILRACIVCFKSRPRISEQIMGNLPAYRVTPLRPFSSTGVDCCGPLYVRDGKRRNSKRIKAYVAVFVCMATKAVHLEIVSDMSADAFLNAFKRFIGRRGKPADVYSDNGTNFVGANRELEELRSLFTQEEHRNKIIDATASDRIRWHFIPPRAPHFGGLWEAAVKSFKSLFYKVASDAALTFEDPNDMSYLSAGHFLIGSTLTSYPEPDITMLKINRLSRWQRLEQIRQHFWKRWSSEYLLKLQQRTKWQTSQGAQLQIGQLFVCREDGLPPLKWVLGRVQDLCPGSDEIIRAAIVKTITGVYKRPAAKLCILPIEAPLNDAKV